MIILAGSIRIAAGQRAAAQAHLEAIVRASRSEPGCIAYHFAFDVFDNHLVRIFEVFADREAREAHRNAPHMAAWRAVWADLGIYDRQMAEYEVADWRSI